MKFNRLFLGSLLVATGLAHADISFTPSLTYTAPDSRKNYDQNYGYDLALGYIFDSVPELALELNYADTDSKLHGSRGKHPDSLIGSSTEDNRYGLNAYYAPFAKADRRGLFSPYVLLGGGRASYETDAPYFKSGAPTERNSTENYNAWYGNAGIGAFYYFTQNVALRAEYRFVYTDGGDLDDHLYDNVGLLGVQFVTGAAPVPYVAPVVEPTPAPVIAAPVDSDGDGVTDDRDQCPNTPSGVSVDSVGCPLDADKDGVPDYLDKCPNTAPGVAVYTEGDKAGCDKVEVLTTPITETMNIQFDTGKSVIKEQYYPEIIKVAQLMQKYPDAYVEVQGHTDSTGSKATNNRLSQARADAVKNAVVKLWQEYGIKPDHISAHGYGSTQPIATNKTAAGRAQNRRVVAVVTAEEHHEQVLLKNGGTRSRAKGKGRR